MTPEDRFPDGSIYLCGDIRTDRLPNEDIDAVVHLAALAGVRTSLDRPFDYHSTRQMRTPQATPSNCALSTSPRPGSFPDPPAVSPDACLEDFDTLMNSSVALITGCCFS